MDERVGFFTIATRRELAHAKTLFASLRAVNPDADTWILVADDDDAVDLEAEGFDRVGRISGRALLGDQQYRRLAYSYDAQAFRRALKPFALRALLSTSLTTCLYLDPDVLVLGPLDGLIERHREAEITLAPFLTATLPLDDKTPREQNMLQRGAYDLGYLGVRRGAESLRFLDWWCERLETLCVDDPSRGLAYDQRWVDLVPGFFDRVAIVRDRRYAVSCWNLSTRPIAALDPPRLDDGTPIAFLHFTGFDPVEPAVVAPGHDRLEVEPRSPLQRVLADYARRLFENGYSAYRRLEYGHDYDEEGLRIDDYVRRAIATEPSLVTSWLPLGTALDTETGGRRDLPFRWTHYVRAVFDARPDLQEAFPDPLAADAAAFYGWLREHGLREANRKLVGNALRDLTLGEGEPENTIRVVGYLRSESGVGASGRSMYAALRMLGRRVSVVDVSQLAPSRQEHSAARSSDDPAGPAVTVVCMNAEELDAIETLDVDPRRGTLVGSWWWELPDFERAAWRHAEGFAEIWVGSQFVLDALAKTAPLPIVRIPPVVVRPSWVVDRVRGISDDFRFLYVFDYLSIFERKNPLAIVEAFRRAFPEGSELVRLTIKSVNGSTDRANAFELERAARIDPRIEVIDEYYTSGDTRQLIASADAYVSLHRSEGFGLTLAEAMSYGKPVIATGWSGNMDYMNASNSFPVPYRLVPILEQRGPYRVGQFWADPDIGAAAATMRRVFETAPPELAAIGARASETMRREYAPSAVAARIADRLERLTRAQAFALATPA